MIIIYIINLYIFNYLVLNCAGFSKIGFSTTGFSTFGFSPYGCGAALFIGRLCSMAAYTRNSGRYVTLLDLKVVVPQRLFCLLLTLEYKHTIPRKIEGYKRYMSSAHAIHSRHLESRRYPTLRTVSIRLPYSPNFFRRVRICISTVRVSPRYSEFHTLASS